MAKEVVVPNQGIRERHLNIVYFVDSSKSHSMRINLVLARWILAGSIGLVLWSVLSLGWIISLGSVLKVTRDHLETALTSIFNYQVKYDRVFEQAYPESSTQGYYASGSQLPVNSPVDLDGAKAQPKVEVGVKQAPSTKDSLATSPPAAEHASVRQESASMAVAATSRVTNDSKEAVEALAMDIKNTLLTAQNGKMTLLFDISNKDAKRRAEGYIWATGTLQLPGGATKRIVAPPHTRLKADGTVDAVSSTYKFSIQKFKRKDFTFAVPADESWKVSDLTITYVNADGKLPQTVPITLPVTFKKAESSLEGQKSGTEIEASYPPTYEDSRTE